MSSAPRLLFVLYEAAFGGVERQAELMAESAQGQGYVVELLVIGAGGPALPRFEASCESITVLNADFRNDVGLWRRLRAVADSRPEYEAAFLFSIAKFSVVSNALRRAADRQLLHVGNPAGSTFGERWKQQIRSWVFPPSRRLHLIANSQHTLRSLQRHAFYKRFPLHVSLNCVRLADAPVMLRERCAPIRVGMVARLDLIKDHATLIRAVGHLQRGGTQIECELLGRGPLERELNELAGNLGLLANQTVRFLGWSSAVSEVVSRWDIFVFSVTDREGFGNAVAEAMGQGLPCILTDVGPCREVGGDAVEYVPPHSPELLAERIACLALDHARRNRLGAAAYTRADACFRARRKLDDFLSIAST